jgi:hypothetical protein
LITERRIGKKCMNQMLLYEGEDLTVEAQTGTTKKRTYLASKSGKESISEMLLG